MWRQVMGGGAGPASSPWLAHREQWTVDGTEFHDAEVACGSWTRVLRSQVSLPPPVAVVMERLPNDRALFHKETFWHCLTVLSENWQISSVFFHIKSASKTN